MDATPGDGRKRNRSLSARLLRLPAWLRAWWSEWQFAAPPDTEPATAPAWMGLPVLLLTAAPLLFLNLYYPLLEPDENRNAQIALEMFQSGDYVVPTRIGDPYLYKPPLLFWLISASYGLFGVNEWAARLPIALAALFTVAMTYWLGRRAVGQRAAWLGAILLLLTGGFVLIGRFLLIDGLLTMCVTIGLLAAYAGATQKSNRALWWLAAGIACGIGILAKGPVALVLVVPPLVAASWLSRRDITIRWSDWLILVGTSLVVALPWYVLVSIRYPEFPQTFLWTQNLQRYTTGIDHQQPFWFYVPVLFAGMLPASLLFPALALLLTSRREELRRLRTPALGMLTLSAAWIVFFFSLSTSKLPTYILPAIPSLCLLLGKLLDAVLWPASEPRVAFSPFLQHLSRQLPRYTVAGFGLIGLAGAAADLVLGRDGWPSMALSAVVGTASLVLVGAALTGRIHPTAAGWSLAGAAGLVAMTLGFNDLYPEIAARRSRLIPARAEVAAARELAHVEKVPIALYGTLSESTSFYMDDRGLRKFSKDQGAELLALAHEYPRIKLLATRSYAASFRQSLPSTHKLVRIPENEFLFEVVDLRSPAERSLARRPAEERH